MARSKQIKETPTAELQTLASYLRGIAFELNELCDKIDKCDQSEATDAWRKVDQTLDYFVDIAKDWQ